MAGVALQHLGLGDPVFEDLRRQFDEVAQHLRARQPLVGHVGQQPVQAMAEFVEQRDHVVVAQQGGLVAHGRREVAHQVRHRQLQTAVGPAPAGTAVVHPGARTLAGAGVEVQVESRHRLAAAPDAVEAHAVVPERCAVFADGHVEQRLDQPEQARQHARFGEIPLEILFAEGIARLPELFGGASAIPGLKVGQAQLPRSELAQFGHFTIGVGPRAVRQFAHEGQHFAGRACHLGHQGQVRIGVVAKQRALLALQTLHQFGRRVDGVIGVGFDVEVPGQTGEGLREDGAGHQHRGFHRSSLQPVSYTHLTLPTSDLV